MSGRLAGRTALIIGAARGIGAGIAQRFVEEVPDYSEDVIACVKDVCNYIYDSYGRFPAHVDAMYVPGVWVQAHHLDLKYYDQFYQGGYADAQRMHEQVWHD